MVKVLVLAGGADEPRPTVKEVASMRRIVLVLAAAALVALMSVAVAAPAFAHKGGVPGPEMSPSLEMGIGPT